MTVLVFIWMKSPSNLMKASCIYGLTIWSTSLKEATKLQRISTHWLTLTNSGKKLIPIIKKISWISSSRDMKSNQTRWKYLLSYLLWDGSIVFQANWTADFVVEKWWFKSNAKLRPKINKYIQQTSMSRNYLILSILIVISVSGSMDPSYGIYISRVYGIDLANPNKFSRRKIQKT